MDNFIFCEVRLKATHKEKPQNLKIVQSETKISFQSFLKIITFGARFFYSCKRTTLSRTLLLVFLIGVTKQFGNPVDDKKTRKCRRYLPAKEFLKLLCNF